MPDHESESSRQNYPKDHALLKQLQSVKIAYRIVFYGLQTCLTCAMLFPLISIAEKGKLITRVESHIYSNKTIYKEQVCPILNQYDPNLCSHDGSELPIPIILLQARFESPDLHLVSPSVVAEVGMSLSDEINRLDDKGRIMEYLDGEMTLTPTLLGFLHKISQNVIFKQ